MRSPPQATLASAGAAPEARTFDAPTPGGRVLIGAGAAGLVLVLWWCWLRFGEPGPQARRVASDVGFVLAPLVAAWSGWRAARREQTAARAWRWLAAGCLTWAAASVVWAGYELGLGRLAPFPSYADVGYIGYVIPMAVGLWSLPRVERPRKSPLHARLDGALIVSSVLFVSWTLVLEKVYGAPAEHAWYRLDAMAYPSIDAFMVSLVLALGVGYAVRRRLSWSLLTAGLVTLAVTDSTYAVASVEGTYTAGTALDLRWIAAFALIALAAEASSCASAPSAAAERLTDLVDEGAPYVPLAAAAVVAAVTQLTPATDPAAFALGCVLFVVAAVRQAVLVLDHRRLTDDLDQQVLDRTRALSESETRMRALLANLSDAVLILDPSAKQSRLSYVSPAMQALLGVSASQLCTAEQLAQRVHPHDAARFARLLQVLERAGGSQREQVRLAHLDGSWRTVEVTGTNLIADPAVAGTVLVLHDVTDRERLQHELRLLASHDALTGLGNRRALYERLTSTIARADRRGERTALVLFDLDGFKAVNDTLGHAAGDELLILAGQRLCASARAGDYVCRLGGDEFAVILEAGGSYADELVDVLAVGERLIGAFREPFALSVGSGEPLQLSASGGISVRDPGGSQDAGALLREADLAMYAVKADGKDGLRIFDPTIRDTTLSRLALHEELRRALPRDEFVLHYQPLVDVASGRIRGVEALVRWQHPERGLLLPGQFVAAAEASGLIVPIGAWVLAGACAQLRDWQNSYAPDLTMSVNVSPRQLGAAWTGQVVRALRDHQLTPASLTLEITEELLVEDLPDCLDELTALGVRLSVDDFGTGYSSLSRLRRFPVDELKIDRSFLAGIGQDNCSSALVASIVDLAHALNLSVVAEGVEEAAQLAFLREQGCDLAQGFLLARPAAAAAIGNLLQRQELTQTASPARQPVSGEGLASDASSAEIMVRRLLHRLEEITGYESTYLTTIDWGARTQRIAYARNSGELAIPEGLSVDWEHTVCRQMLDGGPRASADPLRDYPDSPAVAELGLGSYAGVPVYHARGGVYGTLCAASTTARRLDERTVRVMELFAELIGESLPQLTPDQSSSQAGFASGSEFAPPRDTIPR